MRSLHNNSVRDSMLALPNWLQPFITWMTGKPYSGQKPLFRSTPMIEVATTLIVYGVAITCAISILTDSGSWVMYFLLIPCWILITGMARKIQVTLCHHCVHYSVTGKKTIDRYIMEVLSTIVFVQDFERYYEDHVMVHHNPLKQCTLEDPDLQFLVALGIVPGLKKKYLWKKLWGTLFSPRFHFLFLKARFMANVVTPSRYRKVMVFVFWCCLLAVVAYNHAWGVFFLAWFFPMTILYHISSLLQFICEHRWLLQVDSSFNNRDKVTKMNLGRFCGAYYPETELLTFSEKILKVTSWWFKMMTIHFPTRIFVLVGDLPVHDFHHRNPGKSGDWPNAIYARQYSIDNNEYGNLPYSEAWGLINAIDEVFTVLSSTPTLNDEKRDSVKLTDGILGM